MADAGRRGIERDLAANPGDGDGWLRAAHQELRVGRPSESRRTVLRGLRLNPDHVGLLALATEQAEGVDPWPSSGGGFTSARAALVIGPSEGVQRWRAQLPYEPVGCPLVHSDGSVFVPMFPSGILRVAADASDTSVHSDWWPPDVAPVLRDGLPVAFDPGLDEVSGAGVFGDSPQELWLAALGEHGWSYALGSSHVLGVGQEPTDRWVSPCTAPRSLAVSPHGPLAVIAQRKLNVLSSSGVSLFQSGLDFVDHAAFSSEGALVSSGWRGTEPVVQCVEPDGTVRWERRYDSAAFAVGEERVVVIGATGGASAFDIESGAPSWRQPELRAAGGVAIDAREYAYVLGPGWFAGVGSDGGLLFRLPLPTRGAMSGVALGRDGTAFVTVGRELVAIR